MYDTGTQRGRDKAQRLPFYLAVTGQLHAKGLFTNLSYPIATTSGELAAKYGPLRLVLFNYVPGNNLADAYPLSPGIKEQIAEQLAKLHRATGDIAVENPIVEQYDVEFIAGLIESVEQVERTRGRENEFTRRLYDIIIPAKGRIYQLVDRMLELRDAVCRQDRQMVLCHGDVWGGNLILHPEGELYFVDWEGAQLAPAEYDLLNYLDDDHCQPFLDRYEARRGQRVPLSSEAFGFFQYRRHLRNLSNWVTNIMYDNTAPKQSENDLDMIVNHCMDRWEAIEPRMRFIADVLSRQ